jgi:hypothetical protein
LISWSGQAAFATCTETQKAAILANLPPCGDDPPNCAGQGDACKDLGIGGLVCNQCLQELQSATLVATCTLLGPPIQFDGGWCRY